ncbi:MAG: hypothetical protein AB7V26_03720 [Lysobacterales bacterium]
MAWLAWLAAAAMPVVAAEWTPVVSPRGQIFPALILVTANMPERRNPANVIGDSNGLIGVRLLAAHDGQKVSVRIELPGWLRPTTFKAVLPRQGVRYTIYPTLSWQFEKLRAALRPAPETVLFRVTVDQQAEQSQSIRVRLRSINDVPYFIASKRAPSDLSWMFAGYVDEDHPRVAAIIKQALAGGVVKRFDGYQQRKPQAVLMQVFAIWNLLQKHGIQYSSITRTGNAGSEVYAQHVRSLDQSWLNNQANCVDGSVLLASVLRKLDLNPALILMPGHMLLGFELSPGGDRAYLETTLLDAAVPGPDGKLDRAESFDSFVRATERGYARYQRGIGHFGDLRQPEYQIIDIGAARALGVVPIGGP